MYSRARARPRRAATLPHRQLARATVDELPVNLQADAPHVDPLVHRVSHPRRAVVGMNQPAVNRDPLAQAIGVHDHLPHLRGCDRDPGRGGDEAHGVRGTAGASGWRTVSGRPSRRERSPISARPAARTASHSPSACSTAESKECSSHAEQLGGVVVGRQQVPLQAFHQRQHQLGILAGDRRRHAGRHGCQVQPRARAAGRSHEHQLGDAGSASRRR